MITEALAIELTKNHLVNGQDEKPIDYWIGNDDCVAVRLSDGRLKIMNRVEVEHARIMLEAKNGK